VTLRERRKNGLLDSLLDDGRKPGKGAQSLHHLTHQSEDEEHTDWRQAACGYCQKEKKILEDRVKEEGGKGRIQALKRVRSKTRKRDAQGEKRGRKGKTKTVLARKGKPRKP